MVHTILFFFYFWVSLVFSLLICLPFGALMLLGLEKRFRHGTQFFVRAWARSVLAVAGVRVSTKGLELIPDTPRLCFVANHQGDMDILLVLACIERTVGFVAKKEALYIPFLNVWIADLGSVFIDRKNAKKALRSIERGAEKIRRGHAMIVFPEGTRSQSARMGAFRSGSLKLATKAGATIVPVTIDGTWRIWEERKRISPTEVSFTVHGPIPTEGMGSDERKLLAERVRAAIAAGLPSPAQPT